MDQNQLAESVWGAWGSSKEMRHLFAWHWLGWNLARQIKAMRIDRGWTQAELARRAGITSQLVGRYEKTCCVATLSNLLKIAHAFDVALIVRFGPFSEMLVLMADGAVVVPRTFDDDLAALKAAKP